jgi:hypothetical protein
MHNELFGEVKPLVDDALMHGRLRQLWRHPSNATRSISLASSSEKTCLLFLFLFQGVYHSDILKRLTHLKGIEKSSL